MFDLKKFLPETKENYEGENIDKLKRLIIKIINEELTKKQKEYFYLYVMENRKITEIAVMKGVSKSAVSNNLRRSREKIRKIVGYTL
ncbi:MAG: hypothetical protein E7564_02210 [Ruminococcaceae bacterium]|nr:hypothetical protein [Oscillospiraceae bacterium]